jgi:hypothetical protein
MDPRKVAEIDDLLADEDDADIKAAVREKLVAQLQAETNERVRFRKAYREAFQAARDAGDPHPRIKAQFAVRRQQIVDQYAKRVRALTKRAEDVSRRSADRTQLRFEKASKSTQPHRRRFAGRDREYVEIIGEAQKSGYLHDVPLVLSKIKSKLNHYRLDHWEKTTTPLKVMAMAVVGAREGAQTINLHLNPDTCKKALASPKGPAVFLQGRIRQAFERVFGKGNVPDFWFVIETEFGRDFHLHGMVITPAVVNGRDLVDSALRAAGGRWLASGGHQHQQVSDDPWAPLGWASYVVKRLNTEPEPLQARPEPDRIDTRHERPSRSSLG